MTPPPIGAIQTPTQALSIAAGTQRSSAEAFRQLVIAQPGGHFIRLGDVAKVYDSVSNLDQGGWLAGKPTIMFAVQRQPDANTVAVVDAIRAKLPQIEAALPADVIATVFNDASSAIRAAVSDVSHTLILTIGLVMLVIFLFLRRIPAALVPGLAVPLSLVATVGLMYFLGYSIDNISLLALTLSVGLVVQAIDAGAARDWAGRIGAALQADPAHFIDVASDDQDNALQARIRVDFDAATRLGISAKTLRETLEAGFGSYTAAQIQTTGTSHDVILSLDRGYGWDEAALAALQIAGMDFTIIALIGLLMLFGIVKKNTIMMIDVALDLQRQEGKSTPEAIRIAAERRFRPIMMTTFCALLGTLPIALGTGASSELRQPLGIAVVGGLVVSQLLTLFITPVIFVQLDRLSNWAGRLRRGLRPGMPA